MAISIHARALFWFALLAVFDLLQLPVAIRENLDESLDLDEDTQVQSDTCRTELRKLYSTMTYRDLYSPLLETTYRLRNRFTGKYLTALKDSSVDSSLMHINKDSQSDWRIKRVSKPGMPLYTVQNTKTKKYLVGSDLAVRTNKFRRGKVDAHGQWRATLSQDGSHRIFSLPAGVLAQGDKAPGALTDDRVVLGGSTATEGDALYKTEWYLEARPSWFRVPKSDQSGYEEIWGKAGNIPIWPTTNLTWLQMCETLPTDCEKSYAAQRDQFKKLGVISETHRRYTTENDLSGSCATNWNLMTSVLGHAAEALDAMRTSVAPACDGEDLRSMSKLLKEGIVEECFSGCLKAAEVYLEAINFNCQRPENTTAFWDGLLASGKCNDVMPDSLTRLTQWAMGPRCLTWYEPYPLWLPEFQGHFSLAVADGEGACVIPAGKESTRNDNNIQQGGVCPSGTTCQCPSDFFNSPTPTEGLSNGGELFLQEADTIRAVVRNNAGSFARGLVLQLGILGATVTGGLLGAAVSPLFLPFFAVDAFKYVGSVASWKCGRTIGCWPVKPAMKNGKCRFPGGAKDGGSQVWFMPHPNTLVRRKKWYSLGRRCETIGCQLDDRIAVRIGFEGKNIYNCQPLPYEEMTEAQQTKYLDKIRETLPSEYEGEI